MIFPATVVAKIIYARETLYFELIRRGVMYYLEVAKRTKYSEDRVLKVRFFPCDDSIWDIWADSLSNAIVAREKRTFRPLSSLFSAFSNLKVRGKSFTPNNCSWVNYGGNPAAFYVEKPRPGASGAKNDAGKSHLN